MGVHPLFHAASTNERLRAAVLGDLSAKLAVSDRVANDDEVPETRRFRHGLSAGCLREAIALMQHGGGFYRDAPGTRPSPLATVYSRIKPALTVEKPVPRRRKSSHAYVPTVTIDGLLKGAACRHGVTVKDIFAHNRKRPLVIARHEVWYQAGALFPNLSWPAIARLAGNGRDHTTVIHGARMHAERNGLPVIERARP